VRSSQRREKSSSPKSETVSGEAESINSMLEQSNDWAAIESSDSKKGNAGKAKKPAWNKPASNGVAEITSPVMDATSWPALSESTKPSPKPSPAESSSKIVSDGSIPTSQVLGFYLFLLFLIKFREQRRKERFFILFCLR